MVLCFNSDFHLIRFIHLVREIKLYVIKTIGAIRDGTDGSGMLPAETGQRSG